MKRKIFSILFALVLVISFSLMTAVPTAEANPDPTTLSVSKWTEYAGNPVFAGTNRAYYPHVLAIGGTYHMWYTDTDGAGAYQVGYTTSADGISWDDPPTMVTGLTGKPSHLVVVNVGTEASPHYRIWYADGARWPYNDDLFRTAESGDGVTWIDDQQIVQANNLIRENDSDNPAYIWVYGSYGPGAVLYNPAGYDSLNEEDPMGNKYVMYYDQYTRYGSTGVNEVTMLAISVDGIDWKRYGDEPVLHATGGSTAWDAQYAYAWTVLNSDDGYHMWYSGGIADSNDGIGYAYSADGLIWAKDPNPVLHVDDVGAPAWRQERTYTPTVLKEGDAYKIWFSGKGSAYTIGYATADDPFPSIQSAINAANPGDIINVAAGTYEEDIEITKSNLTLKGIGDPPPVIDGGGGVAKVVYVHNATHVTIENFEVTGGTGDLVYGKYADNITIRSITAHGSTGDEGIQVKYSDNVTIEDCTSYDNMGDGICVSYGSGHLIKHNVIYDNNDRGIYLYGDWGGVPLSDARIEDNTVYGSRGTVPGGSDRFKEGGIICYYTQGIEIVGNFIYENIGPGIHLYKMNHGRPEDVTSYVRDNHVHDNIDGDTPGDGIHAYLTYNTIISNNELDNNAGAGVTLTTQYPDGTEYMFEEPNSGVQVLANDIYRNTDGLQVISRLGDHGVHLNNIHTNTVGAEASQAADGVTVDATNNWWGHSSGPTHAGNPGGTGDSVSDNVNYDPWTGAGVEDSKTEPTSSGPDTVDAITDADTEVVKTGDGTPTITAAKYSSNPGTGFSGDIGKYVDVHIDDPTGVTEIEIRLYYTNPEIAGRVESSLRLHWWDGTSWVACSDSGVNTTDTPPYSGYMWAKVRSNTVPKLTQLSGTAFSGHGGTLPPPPPPPTVTLESIAASPPSLTLGVDETQQLTVTATYSDESTDDVTAEASYESSVTSVATVSDAGLITGVAEGSATITVSYETKTDTVSVTVIVFTPWSYDADADGVIDKSEALTSVTDYFDGFITKAQALEVIALYFAS